MCFSDDERMAHMRLWFLAGSAFSAQVAAHLGFDEHHANQLIIEDKILTGSVKIQSLKETDAALKDLIKGLASQMRMLAVGDGRMISDVNHAGTGVALHAKTICDTM